MEVIRFYTKPFFIMTCTVSSKVITSAPWIMESDLNIVEEEQTTAFLPEEVGTGFVQVITTPAAEIGPHHFVPVSAVVEEDNKFEETRRTFEEVFGLV